VNPNHKFWNNQQKILRQALKQSEDFEKAIGLLLDQHAMVHSEAMSESGLWSFEDEIWHGLSDENARVIPIGGEHSIVWIFWHLTRIEDMTMNVLLAGQPQVFYQDGWFSKIGIPNCDTGNSMDRTQIATLSTQIKMDALREFRIAIGLNTRNIINHLQPSDLELNVQPSRLQSLLEDGSVMGGARGLLDYWGSLTYAGLLLMPPTRHNFIHLNEALRIKHKIR
jgi:hypothetical protein